MKNIRKFCLVGLLTLCSLLCCACGGGSAKRDHTEDPTDSEQLLEQLQVVDGVNEQIAEAEAELVRRGGGQVCSRCGGASAGGDRFCRHCGARL